MKRIIIILAGALVFAGCGSAATDNGAKPKVEKTTKPKGDPKVNAAVLDGARQRFQMSGVDIQNASCKETGFSTSGKTYSCVFGYDDTSVTDASDWTVMLSGDSFIAIPVTAPKPTNAYGCPSGAPYPTQMGGCSSGEGE